ncbi:MAG: Fe-S cluster assembly protein SufD [Proteobacteria bacterium]|nr:Fe-S cluster assembly protein SufD [Pseudomonadota bacterium]MDA1059451.1 Fe-S cluster assembly protein SufD [Pseudomonadota bacterium]
MSIRRIAADFPFLATFDAARAGLPGAPIDWLQAARRDGLVRFRDQSLPSRRVESWKYTDLRDLATTDFAAPDGPIGAALRERVAPIGTRNSVRLVIANGRIEPDLSRLTGLPAGVHLMPMSVALDSHTDLLKAHIARVSALDGDGLLALNAAFMMDGYVLVLDDGAQVAPTIEIVFAADGGSGPIALHPRNLIVMGQGSAATVVETHVGDGVYWSNPVSEIVMGQGASLRRYKVQQESAAAFHLAQDRVALASGAHYRGFLGAFGARLARQSVTATINGADAAFDVAGTYLLRDNQHGDITTLVDHAAGGSSSRQVYKGVLDDAARGVFQGKVAVRRDAQKTDAHQLNNALLLSDKAEIDAKPELEIYADDVKCSHGATTGDLDADALFYLQARGIDTATARRLLVSAFVKAALDEIDGEAERARFEVLVDTWLAGTDG